LTIARKITDQIGMRAYLPEGPYGASGNYPMPSFAPGEVVVGELGAEFEFVFFAANAAVTLNQGDCIVYDNSGYGIQSLTGTGAHPFGASMGFFFLGGRNADQATQPAPGNIWSYTFATPGIYGIWVQRAGKGLVNCLTVNAQTKQMNTTAVPGQLNAPATALVGSMGTTAGELYACPTSWTFTGTTTAGSAVITNVSWTKTPGITKGQTISGAGIPTGAVVTDFNGSTVTMNLAATSTNAGETVTVSNAQTYVTTTSGSPVLTNVTSIAGLYPNQTLTGTGIAGVIQSIVGNAAPYTITMSANSTATGNGIAAVPSVYIEAFIYWPMIATQN
jgi:hypothetical protein